MSRWSALHRRLNAPGPLPPAERILLSLLAPAGWLYGLVGAARAGLYRKGMLRTYRAPVPVVAVGNLAVGGTGKTPVVDHVVQCFLAWGYRVAVVSRGYGGSGAPGGLGVVSAGDGHPPLLPPEVCGDEPYLLALRNPRAAVVVAPRRAQGVRHAVESLGARVIVLDDGFQHLAVARDLDVVLLDARNPLGNGRPLPAGVLREFPSALRRGHLFILTRCGAKAPPLPDLPGPVLLSRHVLDERALALDGASIPLGELAGRRLAAFAGIADPEGFFADLRARGIELAETISLPDHAAFGPAELERLEAAARRSEGLVTTEKDGVKLLGKTFSAPCWRVPVRLEFSDPGELERILRALFADGGNDGHFPRTA